MSIEQITNIYVGNFMKNSGSAYQNDLMKLSSGNKYNSLADNAVVVSTSIKVNMQINSNANIIDGMELGNDMLDQALSGQDNILTNVSRIRDLALKANNGYWANEDLNSIYKEIQAQLDAINNISANTAFNGKHLLDGSATNIIIKTGTGESDQVVLDDVLINSSSAALNIDFDPAVDNLDDYLDRLDNAFTVLNENQSKIGAIISKFDDTMSDLSTKNITLEQYNSEIMDTDVAEASADMVRQQIIEQASANIFVQNAEMSRLRTQLFIQ